ncbi:hypothetical protein [Nonomuraea sp. NPDC002799]
MVDRAVHGWIADECSRSTIKNSLAVLVRAMEQAVRDRVIDQVSMVPASRSSSCRPEAAHRS